MNDRLVAVICCPSSDSPEAMTVTRQLIEKGLAVCANILPPGHSIFRWQGQIQEENENFALIKSSAALLQPAIERLAVRHSYDTPVVTGWLADHAAEETLQCLDEFLPLSLNK